MMNNKIILTVQDQNCRLVGQAVKIREDAAEVIGKFMRKTGMSAKEIVSEIIVQAADFVEIVGSEEDEE